MTLLSTVGKASISVFCAWTYLRIVKHEVGGQEAYTAYTSINGTAWDKGITWDHDLGPSAKIGLISLGGAGFTAQFAYVHVSTLR